MKYVLAFMLYTGSITTAYVIITEQYNNCQKKEQAVFVLECIKNANPKSDEEPEDWIGDCKTMSNDLFCEISIRAKYSWGWFSPMDSCFCDECIYDDAIEYCRSHGFTTKQKGE